MIKVAPSILSANFNELGKDVDIVTRAGADYIHADVMDGRFVPNITIGPVVIKRLKEVTTLPLDVHLMIVEPEKYVKDFIDAGADIISIQQESTAHVDRALQLVRSLGAKPSIAINPATPIEVILPVLPIVDQVLIMTVNPGFGGQKLITYCIDKVKQLREKIDKLGLNIDIEVDGGVTEANAAELIQAGVNVLVAGSTVFQSKNIPQTIQRLKAPK